MKRPSDSGRDRLTIVRIAIVAALILVPLFLLTDFDSLYRILIYAMIAVLGLSFAALFFVGRIRPRHRKRPLPRREELEWSNEPMQWERHSRF